MPRTPDERRAARRAQRANKSRLQNITRSTPYKPLFNVGRLSRERQREWVREQLGTDYHSLPSQQQRMLARYASYARWGEEDEEFLEFEDLWYHEGPR
jgi:hypothetical protein